MHGGIGGGGGSHGGSHGGHGGSHGGHHGGHGGYGTGSHGHHGHSSTTSGLGTFALIDVVGAASRLQGAAHEAEALGHIDAMVADKLSLTDMSGLVQRWHEAGDQALEAAAWIGLAQARARARSRYGAEDEVIEAYRAALALCREIGDRVLELTALTGLGKVERLDLPEATAVSARAAELWREAGDQTREAEALLRLGQARAKGAEAHTSAGQRRAVPARETANPREAFEESLADYRRALDLARAVGDEALETRALNGAAYALVSLHRFDEVLELRDQPGGTVVIEAKILRWAKYAAEKIAPSERAAADYASAGERVRAAQAWTDAAAAAADVMFDLQIWKPCVRAAAEARGRAADLWGELGDSRREAEATTDLAAKLLSAGQYVAEAAGAYREAADLWHGLGERAREADALSEMARAHAASSHWPWAVEPYRRAADLWRALGNRARETDALMRWGEACRLAVISDDTRREADDHIREARAAYARALAIQRKRLNLAGWVRVHRTRLTTLRQIRWWRKHIIAAKETAGADAVG